MEAALFALDIMVMIVLIYWCAKCDPGLGDGAVKGLFRFRPDPTPPGPDPLAPDPFAPRRSGTYRDGSPHA